MTYPRPKTLMLKAGRMKDANLLEIRATHLPEPIFKAYARLFADVWTEGTLSHALKEMLRLKSAEIGHCAY